MQLVPYSKYNKVHNARFDTIVKYRNKVLYHVLYSVTH